MKIAFIRVYDFPIGGAPQNRWMGILRGLIEQGCKIEVHVFGPSLRDIELNRKKFQIHKSVPIFNHAWKWSPAKSKMHRLLGIFSGVSKVFISVIKSHKCKQFDWVFFNSNKFFYAFPFFVFSKLLGARFLRELNEFPEFILNPDKYNIIKKYFMQRTNYIWFDDFFIMTKELLKYYRPLARKKARFLLLPMTVDMDRFPEIGCSSERSWDISYCGDLSQGKDCVLNLIEAFALIKDEFPKCQLKLIGRNKDQKYMSKLVSRMKDIGIISRVLLTGFVEPDRIPEYLYRSRLLVLSRPDSKQAQGAFPTKLGEYLASGVPVAVTRVGEITDYLIDGKNAFLAKPGDIKSFADAMRRSLSDQGLSQKIGAAGRQTAIKYFSHSVQGKMMKDFLTNIIMKGRS
jgi:glycosyltransferase involved in cell wall biosynthesis